MTRAAFMSALRSGLQGMPPSAIEDIAADYEAHFDEGAGAGRSEADVALALGDPNRLARELRAEAGLKRWEAERNPSNAAAAVFAVLGLGAIDVLILLPILLTFGSVVFAMVMVSIALFIGGVVLFVLACIGHPQHFHGNTLQAILAGIGLMAGGMSFGALQALIITALVNGLVWYGRLHYRLLKPAIE